MGLRINSSLDTTGLDRVLAEAEAKVKRAQHGAAERVAERVEANAPSVRGIAVKEMDTSVVHEDDGSKVVLRRPWRQIEFGTVDTAAQPFVVPAAEAERDRFEREVKEAFE